MIIEHRSYGFSKPNFIDEEEYVSLKRKFSENPNLKLAPQNEFWDIFGYTLKLRVLFPFILFLIIGSLRGS